MVATDKFTAERILWLQAWAPNLFSFRITRGSDFHFKPGQFARIGIRIPDPDNPKNPGGQKIVWRAYSVASDADADHLEFFSIAIATGEFSAPLARLGRGDTVYLEKGSYGFLTIDRFRDGRDLWMLGTGTGLAPYLSMLWDRNTWQRFERLIVVHSVRYPNELAYADLIRGFALHERFRSQPATLLYLPVVTRAVHAGALAQRIPAALADGSLQRAAGAELDPSQTRVMMAGNPDMIGATRKLLNERGFVVARRTAPGQMAVENYW